MELAIVGLGKMGGNMAERLLKGGHAVVGMDHHADARARITRLGGRAAEGFKELLAALAAPRTVWLMIPAGEPVDRAIADLRAAGLAAGDTVIDGGNSNYKDSQRRHAQLATAGIRFLDVGTSGGIWGLAEGYCLMIGGDAAPVERLAPVFQTLAPAKDRGWAHVGPAGAGHFTKMIHNGIEYGMMQAFAEGFAIMHKKGELSLDLAAIAELWRHGSVVRSWLLDLTAQALSKDAALDAIKPFVPDSGEGRWTVAEAIDLDVPAPVITLSLQARFRSRDAESYADRLLAVMRNQFGGHAVATKDPARH
ncbi:MAG: decarboxylating 6-phosphogluconate dehydrogenase [Phycisphaeraceae bacterium]|nr:MAG: decarboxylating 6-phosphogluconate dehydrogenase [Phycisphaeraceae bacterium]